MDYTDWNWYSYIDLRDGLVTSMSVWYFYYVSKIVIPLWKKEKSVWLTKFSPCDPLYCLSTLEFSGFTQLIKLST